MEPIRGREISGALPAPRGIQRVSSTALPVSVSLGARAGSGAARIREMAVVHKRFASARWSRCWRTLHPETVSARACRKTSGSRARETSSSASRSALTKARRHRREAERLPTGLNVSVEVSRGMRARGSLVGDRLDAWHGVGPILVDLKSHAACSSSTPASLAIRSTESSIADLTRSSSSSDPTDVAAALSWRTSPTKRSTSLRSAM